MPDSDDKNYDDHLHPEPESYADHVHTEAGDDEEPLPPGVVPSPFPGYAEIVGLVAGVLPFILSYEESKTVNGEVVSYIDYVAVPGGAVAVVAGIAALTLVNRTEPSVRYQRVVAAMALIFAGLYHLGSGLGYV